MKQPDYEQYARFYDFFELAGHEESEEINLFLNELFKLNGVETVLDFAAGTGAQSIGLARLGYKVTATDKSRAMIELAKEKATRHPGLKIDFQVGDMVTANPGVFDAAICIFNAIGHLSSDECVRFFKNAFENIKVKGLFVVDIFNLTAMLAGSFKEYNYLSRELVIDGEVINHVRNCELDEQRRLIKISSMTRLQDGSHDLKTITDDWEMKIYDCDEMRCMLETAGFSEIVFFGPTGSEFDPQKSDSILAVCQK